MDHREAQVDADVLMSGLTRLAFAAAMVEGRRDAVAGPHAGDRAPDLFDDPAVLVTGDERCRDVDVQPGPSALPQIIVTPADAVRLDTDDRFVGAAVGVCPVVLHDERLANLLNNRGLHETSFLWQMGPAD
jgi:hypothetical protein